MRKVGKCLCGSKGFKIKYGSSVCERCDKIESYLKDMFKMVIPDEEKENFRSINSDKMYLE